MHYLMQKICIEEFKNSHMKNNAQRKVTFTKWLGHRNTKCSFLCNLKRNCPNCSLVKCDENTSSISGTKRHSSVYLMLNFHFCDFVYTIPFV